jgi:HSP20 family protein
MLSILPWSAKRLPVRREDDHAVHTLHHEVNRLFEDFLRTPWEGLGSTSMMVGGDEVFGAVSPRIDMSESDKELVVKAELPGLMDKDIEVYVNHETLTIRGEKKQEKEENEKGWYRMERQYGSFSRSIPLPYEVDTDRIEALLKNGVLTVKMPKLPVSQKSGKTVSVKNI